MDQLGYTPGDRKVAYLLSPVNAAGATFRVVERGGLLAFSRQAGTSRGTWNAKLPNVHPLNFSALTTPGTYRIVMRGAVRGHSPWFQIGSAEALFAPRVADGVHFFRDQRDGPDVVPANLDRQPSHLNDAEAPLYEWPTYTDPDSDVIVGSKLTRIPGKVDLAGGWFDAGDFIKFTHTTAYAVTLMFASARAMGDQAPRMLLTEAHYGLDWLDKAWHEKRGVLFFQVGIGSGNEDGTFNGDHDVWRLPEVDDTLGGPENRYLRHRPAFRANESGTKVPPNLAGRVAAAFASAAQLDAGRNPERAAREFATAREVYAAAKRRSVQPEDIVTALPHAFYPESSWRDDLELAAAELARAAQALGDPSANLWIGRAAHWAHAYLRKEAGDDTLNLYDTSALAHADLVTAMRQQTTSGASAGATPGIGEGALIGNLRTQLRIGRQRAAADPFRAGAIYSDFDAAPHTFGLVATAQLYAALTGDHRFDRFATSQRDWAMGANAWGVSLMVGVGTTFPHCMQHVVANLSGSVNGTPPLVRGAVVNGPNDETLFSDGLGEFFDKGVTCPADGNDRYERFTGHGSRFVDDVRSWQTVEPALDFTAAAMLAFSLSATAD